MIITHTFNPSIDITYNVEQLQLGNVHRPVQIIKNAGGKGLNVSKVLLQLGADLKAHTYLGGENGQWIERQLIKKVKRKMLTTLGKHSGWKENTPKLQQLSNA